MAGRKHADLPGKDRKRFRILFFGDSNTYGYDPSVIFGGRYAAEIRWTDRLAEQLGDDWEILAYGLNGRCIPDLRYEKAYREQMLENAGPVGLFAVMLGTNDVILTPRPDAGKAVRRMEEFLTWLKGTQPFPILLVAPPAMDRRAADIPEQAAYVRETAALAEQYKELARKQDVLFADADSWRISLAHDAVHFSEAGHRRFADEMQSLLESLHAAGKL